MRISVVLPAPFGPNKPKIQPSGMLSEIWSTAKVLSYCFTTWLMLKRGVLIWVVGVIIFFVKGLNIWGFGVSVLPQWFG